MKRTALLLSLGTSTLFLSAALPIFAESTVTVSNNGEGSHTSVKVQSNTGGNTICQNGKCTTTSNGNGTSKVCVNGECHTSENGNVNYESNGGNTKVEINSNTEGSKVSTFDKKIEKSDPTPTTMKDVKGLRDAAMEKKIAVKKEARMRAEQARLAAEANKSSFQRFFEHEVTSIRSFFATLFPF